MNHKDLAERWPFIEKHFDRVVRELERRATTHVCKVSRRAVLKSVRKTQNFRLSGKALGLSTSAVSQIVWRASCIARKLEVANDRR